MKSSKLLPELMQHTESDFYRKTQAAAEYQLQNLFPHLKRTHVITLCRHGIFQPSMNVYSTVMLALPEHTSLLSIFFYSKHEIVVSAKFQGVSKLPGNPWDGLSRKSTPLLWNTRIMRKVRTEG